MLPPGLHTAREVKMYYNSVYDTLIDSGRYQPFLYPWATIGFGVVLIYLLVDHRRSLALTSLRLPIFGFLCASSVWYLQSSRARSSAASYGVGLLFSWGTLWVASIMACTDLQTDCKRINDVAAPASDGRHVSSSNPPRRALAWQEYPKEPFSQRLDWVVDAFTNFRGLGWNFELSQMPSPPAWVQAELHAPKTKNEDHGDYTISVQGIRRYSHRTALLKVTGMQFIIACIVLDVVKLIMHHDPYFWGYIDAPCPASLPSFVQSSHALTKSYRLLVALCALYAALNQVFSLGPLFFCGLLGPRIAGIRGEPWMNPPDFYGSFSSILTHGLAGWWGSWWHQIFRYGFEAPATWILTTWKIEKRSQNGKLIGLFVAFLLSGCLHACGSYTQLGDSRPILGPFRFFVLQAVGIAAQLLAAQALQKAGVSQQMPTAIRQLMNFLYAHAWLYFTAHLLVDDFARGGAWLYEPMPVSPLRLLGFGAADENGWDLWYGLVFWRQGKHWWDTGIAF